VSSGTGLPVVVSKHFDPHNVGPADVTLRCWVPSNAAWNRAHKQRCDQRAGGTIPGRKSLKPLLFLCSRRALARHLPLEWCSSKARTRRTAVTQQAVERASWEAGLALSPIELEALSGVPRSGSSASTTSSTSGSVGPLSIPIAGRQERWRGHDGPERSAASLPAVDSGWPAPAVRRLSAPSDAFLGRAGQQAAESSVHGIAVREDAGNVGLQENQVGSGQRSVVVLSPNSARQPCEVIFGLELALPRFQLFPSPVSPRAAAAQRRASASIPASYSGQS
jgi:hypothetical protein